MALVERDWNPVSFHKVVQAFLLAERDTKRAVSTRNARFSHIKDSVFAEILETPDFSNESDNALRLQWLRSFRGPIIRNLPRRTTWFEVQFLEHEDLPDLRVINWGYWINLEEGNDLLKAARRLNYSLDRDPSTWAPPILIAQSRKGPFTIIEGNHRLSAYANSGLSSLGIPVMVGISPNLCPWQLGYRRRAPRDLLLQPVNGLPYSHRPVSSGMDTPAEAPARGRNRTSAWVAQIRGIE